MNAHREDASLPSWSEVAEYADWTGLLAGNGASMVVWPQFGYQSLHTIASGTEIDHPLTDADLRMFDAFGTTNFEQVLAALKTAGIVSDAIGLGNEPVLTERYESVQQSLFDAVHAIHVAWEKVAAATIPALFEALRAYRFVYSTNYDLLLYWASMERGGAGFLDYFWGAGKMFDITDTDIWLSRERWTRILFIHGGIHLRRMRDGGTRKVTADHASILDQFATRFAGDDSPLLVSEGESTDKLASIRSSDYLTFAHQAFASHEGGLVVFGHSLSEQDQHLVTPMKAWRENPIAISLRPNADPEVVIQAKAHFRSRLAPVKDIVFFDSTTHPLGDGALTVPEN